jgi:hypothetical protein
MTTVDKAIELIRSYAKAETDEEREQRIGLYIKMYRAGIDRKDIREILSGLVDKGVIEAAWAVVELKFKEDNTEYKQEDVFGEMTKSG